MALLSQIICALLVLAVLLNGCECRPDPVLGALGGLAGGLPVVGAVSGALSSVRGLASSLPVVGGLLDGLLGGR